MYILTFLLPEHEDKIQSLACSLNQDPDSNTNMI